MVVKGLNQNVNRTFQVCGIYHYNHDMYTTRGLIGQYTLLILSEHYKKMFEYITDDIQYMHGCKYSIFNNDVGLSNYLLNTVYNIQ